MLSPRKLGLGALLLGGAVAFTSPVRADTITLKNGREVFGKVVDEQKDHVILRVMGREGGTIKIWKRDIATYTEDDRAGTAWAGKPRPVLPTDPSAGTGDKGSTGTSGDLGSDEKEAIEKLRAELLAKLKALGKSPDDRLKAAELSPEEAEQINARIDIMKSNKGSRNWQRQESIREIVAFGPKAVKPLVDLLGDKTTVKTQACLGLAELGAKDDERWLIYKNEGPQKLLAILEDVGDEFAGRARENANKALEAITGQSVGWAASEEAFRTEAETKAAAEWKKIVSAAVAKWQAEQKKGGEEQASIAKKLKLLDGPNWRDAFIEDTSGSGEGGSGEGQSK